MEVAFLSWTLSFLFLLTLSVFIYLISKKVNIPYTVLLVIVWIILVPLTWIHGLWFIDDFKLTPDILFFVFLPILLFESAYNMNYRAMLKNWKSISLLSVIGLLISTFVIAGWLFFLFPLINFSMPFMVCLLFWALISATDPVAVLAIFKSIWAPRRLALIFEWESLFNDWTAYAVFIIILGILLSWTVEFSTNILSSWIITFLSMVFWWMLFWWFTWVLFSKIIWKIKNNDLVEVTLTLIVAHLTFVLAEIFNHHNFIILWYNLKISWVIATVIAWVIIWNYWRYKISPKVEHTMEKFWEYFAFIWNSLVFILMWLILSDINLNVHYSVFILPIILSIFVIMIARWISVYIPIYFLNITKLEEKIPLNWQHLLSWWSLRWALALMMALMIWQWENKEKILKFQESVGWQYPFNIDEFIIVLTIWAIMFTLLIKATSISFIMKKMWVTKLNKLEEFEYDESKILANIKIIDKLNKLYSKEYLTNEEFKKLKSKYKERLNSTILHLKKFLNEQWKDANDLLKRAIALHALWIEKKNLKILFEHNEISEKNFNFIYSKINNQKERLEAWETQFRSDNTSECNKDIFEKFINLFREKDNSDEQKYIRNRARVIITRRVIKELEELLKIDFGFDKKIIEDTIKLYKWFLTISKEKMNFLLNNNKKDISNLESTLTDKILISLEEEVIDSLYEKEIITPKLYIQFKEDIEKEIYKEFSSTKK